ncbi:hypothetical protein [Streptomyces flaveolus]|uniref:hypothetical protein n=1 Tax=Streptomyces flaveolus TaxID=67297 RepID=UPI003324B3F5
MTALALDRHLTDAASARVADPGFRPEVVCGARGRGCPVRAPFGRIFVSFTVERGPKALVDQLAPGGRLLVHVTSASPSRWPRSWTSSASTTARWPTSATASPRATAPDHLLGLARCACRRPAPPCRLPSRRGSIRA